MSAQPTQASQQAQIAKYFFQSLMYNQCNICWNLFSQHSQKDFLRWALDDMYQKNPKAAQTAKLGIAEVRLLFEKNDSMLIKTFWKRFYYSSNAHDFFRYGYYDLISVDGNRCTVRVRCQFENGTTNQSDLLLVKERGSWKLAYVESKLPF